MRPADEARTLRMTFRNSWPHRHDNQLIRVMLEAMIRRLRVLRA